MPFRIPNSGIPANPTVTFAVGGTTTAAEGDPKGELRTHNTTTPIAGGKGRLIRYRAHTRRGQTRWRWVILFEGQKATGVGVGSTVDVYVEDSKGGNAKTRAVTLKAFPVPTINIEFPLAGTHCAYGLIAYGTRAASETPLAVEIGLPNEEPILADFIYEDPETGFWCAQFPELADASGYDVRVTGAGGGAASQPGIDISHAAC